MPQQASQGKGQGRKPPPGLAGYVATAVIAWRPSLNQNGAMVRCAKAKLTPRIHGLKVMRRLKAVERLQKELDEGKARIIAGTRK